jgi:predicted RNA-binding protein YlqC (UPF0109 family)
VSTAALRDLLATLAEELVDEPDRVRVHEWTDGGTIVLELEVARDDRGRVIGRQGRTARALRTLVGAVGRQRGIACKVEIRD